MRRSPFVRTETDAISTPRLSAFSRGILVVSQQISLLCVPGMMIIGVWTEFDRAGQVEHR